MASSEIKEVGLISSISEQPDAKATNNANNKFLYFFITNNLSCNIRTALRDLVRFRRAAMFIKYNHVHSLAQFA